MVGSAARWTNPAHLIDTITFLARPERADRAVFCDLYVKNGLSAAEVAAQTGLSKTAVLERLHEAGVRGRRTGRDPENYKFPKNPPYGFRVSNGRLVPDRREMKVARLIVELRDRQRIAWRVIAERLNSDGIRTRKGRAWNIDSVENVYARWSGRV